MCNGYRTDLEPSSALEAVLAARRWDLVDLLLAWGTDLASTHVSTIPATFNRDELQSFSREEVYELVWSQPMTSLAKRFGISDVALHKRCKAMNVPTPGRGHWEKIKHGGKPRRVALPKLPRDPDSGAGRRP